MTHGVILAGGRGSRLGPLASHLSKALVSIESRPQVVNQILWMRTAGVDGEIRVVTSRSTDDQVRAIIAESGLTNVTTRVQRDEGVADAICLGIVGWSAPALVIMSDTIVEETGMPLSGDWVGTAHTADTERHWTYFDTNKNHFVKEVLAEPGAVTNGVYMIEDPRLFHRHANRKEPDVVDTLNAYYGETPLFVDFPSWSDTGDLATLAREHGSRFLHRDHHDVNRVRNSIVKHSTNAQEILMLSTLRDEARTWFPEVRGIKWDDEQTKRSGYVVMDYCDYPTLAETYLYWPTLNDQWEWILNRIIEGLTAIRGRDDGNVGAGNPIEFYKRITERYRKRSHPANADNLTWRKRWERLDCGYALQELVNMTYNDMWAWGHGDPNFTNILMSHTGAVMKFIDPRGGWIPWSYEMAKIAYSPMFSRIVHGLYEHVNPITLAADREMTEFIIDELPCDVKKTKASVALAFFSGAPLHNEVQAEQLFTEGLKAMEEALK